MSESGLSCGCRIFIHAGQAACSYSCRMPVGFNNPAEALTWAYAAASYSLIRPPRIFVRVIRWAGNGMTFGSSSGASSFSPWP